MYDTLQKIYIPNHTIAMKFIGVITFLTHCILFFHSCTGYDDIAAKGPLNYLGSGDGCQPPNLIVTTLINIALLQSSDAQRKWSLMD